MHAADESKSPAVKFWQFTDKTIILSSKGNEKEMKIPIGGNAAVLMMKLLQARQKLPRLCALARGKQAGRHQSVGS